MMSQIENLLPPANPKVEQAFLGQILALGLDLSQIHSRVSTAMFVDEIHQHILQGMITLWANGTLLSSPILEAQLRQQLPHSRHKEIAHYLNQISLNAGYEDLDVYIAILEELYERRELIAFALRLSEMSYDETIRLPQIKGFAGQKILTLGGHLSSGRGATHTAAELWLMAKAQYAKNLQAGAYGIQTGFTDIDALIGGVLAGELLLFAARPGMGKTTFLNQITRYICNTLHKRVLFISLEMSGVSLITRLACNITGLDYKLVMKGNYTAQEQAALNTAETELMAMPLLLHSTSAMCALTELPLLLKSISVTQGFDIVIIDYLGLFSAKGSYTTMDKTSAVVRAFKDLAMEYQVPFVAAVQLNRGVESRQDKHPVLSDLRDSGELEQTADIVFMASRADYYDPSVLHADFRVSIPKQRNGATGAVSLGWNGEAFQIYNHTGQSFPPPPFP